MKRLIIAALSLALSPAAFAAPTDKVPDPSPKTACGTTVEECQRQVDSRDKQIAQYRTALITARQQRVNAQNAQSDAEINAAIAAQEAATATPPPPAKK